MTKTEKIDIGDHEYSVTQWPATKAMVMKLKVGKYVGRIFQVMAQPGDFTTNIMANIGEILEDVNEEVFIELVKEISCTAIRSGERMVKARFDEYFQDNFMEAYQLAFFVLKVNYEDFLASVLSFRSAG